MLVVGTLAETCTLVVGSFGAAEVLMGRMCLAVSCWRCWCA